MPKTTKTKKKVTKTKSKVIKKNLRKTPKPIIRIKETSKPPIKISKTYIPKDTEKYMCDKHKVYFRMKLQEWRKELVKANNQALYNGSMDDNSISAILLTSKLLYRQKRGNESNQQTNKINF